MLFTVVNFLFFNEVLSNESYWALLSFSTVCFSILLYIIKFDIFLLFNLFLGPFEKKIEVKPKLVSADSQFTEGLVGT